MATVTDPQDGAAWPVDDFGQTIPAPDSPNTGLPPVNQVIVNDTAGTGLTKNSDGSYAARPGSQFGVHLAVAPPAAAPVTVSTGTIFGGTTASPATLTFANGNFAADQLVTVSAAYAGESLVIVTAPGVIEADLRFRN